jgi:peptidyl-prolyl cis-trans isomerase SurA
MKYASLFTMAILMTFTTPALAAGPSSKESIVAVVNKGVITASDVKARMDLIAASSGLKPSKELDDKLRPQIIDMLIDEQIRSQEADRLGLKVDPKEIDAGFEQVAKQNNIPADVFKKALEQRGIKVNTMRDQIKAQIAWTKVVQKRIRQKIEITDADIDSELERLKENIGKDQYNIAEIYLPVADPTKMPQAKTFATKLAEQLKAEPDAFPKAARQFSQSPGASQGKSIGWVMQGVLAKEVDALLPTFEKGAISSPIETSTGLYIIKLQDKRQLAADQLPSREEITEKLGMERMDRAQRRYYQDLRAQAFIEKRG